MATGARGGVREGEAESVVSPVSFDPAAPAHIPDAYPAPATRDQRKKVRRSSGRHGQTGVFLTLSARFSGWGDFIFLPGIMSKRTLDKQASVFV